MGRTRGCVGEKSFLGRGNSKYKSSGAGIARGTEDWSIVGEEERRENRMGRQLGLGHLYLIGCGKEFWVLFSFSMGHHLMRL